MTEHTSIEINEVRYNRKRQVCTPKHKMHTPHAQRWGWNPGYMRQVNRDMPDALKLPGGG